jgi:predicted acetyltransferase
MARRDFDIAMLSTGEIDFYAKFGWQRFVGQSFVDDHGTIVRTADEDEGLMVYTTRTQLNQPGVAWVCDWRTGDFW